jgi:hypothetical protein
VLNVPIDALELEITSRLNVIIGIGWDPQSNTLITWTANAGMILGVVSVFWNYVMLPGTHGKPLQRRYALFQLTIAGRGNPFRSHSQLHASFVLDVHVILGVAVNALVAGIILYFQFDKRLQNVAPEFGSDKVLFLPTAPRTLLLVRYDPQADNCRCLSRSNLRFLFRDSVSSQHRFIGAGVDCPCPCASENRVAVEAVH